MDKTISPMRDHPLESPLQQSPEKMLPQQVHALIQQHHSLYIPKFMQILTTSYPGPSRSSSAGPYKQTSPQILHFQTEQTLEVPKFLKLSNSAIKLRQHLSSQDHTVWPRRQIRGTTRISSCPITMWFWCKAANQSSSKPEGRSPASGTLFSPAHTSH